MALRQLKNLLSFLTIFPVQMDENLLTDCAKNMWAFPLIGAFLGLIAGLFGWVMLQILPSIVVGAIVLALLLWMTGLHHADGLLDFGDGIMVHGNAEKKIAVMHDQLTGAGAIGLALMTYLITALAFSQLDKTVNFVSLEVPLVFPGLIIVELSAKLSMVVAAWSGKSVHEGMNTSFLVYMHGKGGNARLIAGLTISFLVAIMLLRFAGMFAVVAAIIIGLVLVLVSHRHFKGVTGDVFGATNELSRMVCSLVLLAVIAW